MSKTALDYLRQPAQADPTPEAYVDFPPDVVTQQIEILERIWDDMQGVLGAFDGAQSYARRLYATREKMKEEGNWPAD